MNDFIITALVILNAVVWYYAGFFHGRQRG